METVDNITVEGGRDMSLLAGVFIYAVFHLKWYMWT